MGVNNKYSAVIFDLFDTIVDFHYEKLPLVTVNGRSVHTTSGDVYKVFSAIHKGVDFEGVDFEHFYDMFKASYTEFEELKRRERREYPNSDRFVLLLKKLGFDPDGKSAELAARMSSAHMNALRLGMEMDLENTGVLEELSGKYRLGLISNFDHSPTARSLIDELGLSKYFEAVIISADIGWRKPRGEIFHECLDQMGIRPQDAVFVGDNYEADVVGSKSVGMDSIWLKRKGVKYFGFEESEVDEGHPDYIFSSLPEILEVL